MKPLLALMVVLSLPAVLSAQEGSGPAPAGAGVEGIVMPDAASVRSGAQPPATSPEPHRRRPSMVGYIDDSTIGSVVRIRFDAGFDLPSPDRAEFFYAKCGCYRGLSPADPAYDPNAPGPAPGVLTSLDYQELYLHAEYAPTRRLSFVGELPFRFLQPQTFVPGKGSFGNQSGVSDVKFGAKYGLVSTASAQLTASFQVWAPSGDASKGMGTNHWSVEPELLFLGRPNDRLAVEAQFGGVRPRNGSAGVPTSGTEEFWGSVLYYGVGPSYEIYRSGETSFAPVVELVGWHVLSGQQTNGPKDASGTNVVNLKVGGRLTFAATNSLYVGWGHALTTATWYDNIVRVEYRMTF